MKKILLLILLSLNVFSFASPFSTLRFGIRNETAKPVFIENFVVYIQGARWNEDRSKSHFLLFNHIHLPAKASKDVQFSQILDLSKIVHDGQSVLSKWLFRELQIGGEKYYNFNIKTCSLDEADFAASFSSHKPVVMIVIKDHHLGSSHPKYGYEIQPLVTSGCSAGLGFEQEEWDR